MKSRPRIAVPALANESLDLRLRLARQLWYGRSVGGGIELQAAVGTALKAIQFASSALACLTADRRFLEARDDVFMDWTVELDRRVAEAEQRLTQLEQEAYRRRIADDEFQALGLNYLYAAYQEPLGERRRMLAYAGAAIADLSLDIGQLARVQRVLRELDPSDVFALYRLTLIPTRMPSAKYKVRSVGALALAVWGASGAEALESSGCITVRTAAGGAGVGSWEELRVTSTGQTVLRALRAYIRAREPDVSDVPGHEVTPEFRSKESADALFSGLPNLRVVLAKVRKRGERIQFDAANIADGAAHDSKTGLMFRVPEAEAHCLGEPVLTYELAVANARNSVLLGGKGEPKDGMVHLQVIGPHDALRFLAYEFDAEWA